MSRDVRVFKGIFSVVEISESLLKTFSSTSMSAHAEGREEYLPISARGVWLVMVCHL
jgi:hypothetical protein